MALTELNRARFWCIPSDKVLACEHSGDRQSPKANKVACWFLMSILAASLSEQHLKQWKGAGFIHRTTQDSAVRTSGAAKAVSGIKR